MEKTSETICKVGDKVVMIDNELHYLYPEFYPTEGTQGIVVDADRYDALISVRWELGSTSRDDEWWVARHKVKLRESILKNKRDTIRALEGFLSAACTLRMEWGYDLDETDALEIYPFEKPFDEVVEDIVNWVNVTVEELQKKENK